MKNVVVVDIDGILADYRLGLLYWIRQSVPEFAHKANEHLKVDNTWIDADTMNMTYDRWLDILEFFRMSGGKRSIPVFKGAEEMLSIFRKKGYKIVLLTSRPIDICSNIYGDTVQWLRDNQLQFDILHWSKSKAEMVHKMRYHKEIVVAIDDEFRHVVDYAKLGVDTVWINLYKMDVKDPYPNVKQYDSLEKYVEVLREQP